MKFENRMAKMTVESIVEEIRKHIRVLNFEEIKYFFELSDDEAPGITVLNWSVCSQNICKQKPSGDTKVLNIEQWVYMNRWTPIVSREGFLKYLIENFFYEDDITYCSETTWEKLPQVIEDAFKLIAEEEGA